MNGIYNNTNAISSWDYALSSGLKGVSDHSHFLIENSALISTILGVALAILLTLVVSKFIYNSLFPKREKIDLYVSMAGNPSHMGHMHMIALAVNRLVAEGYWINEVRVALSGEAYLTDKVYYCNLSIRKHKESEESEEKQEMFKVLLSRAQRIKFLKAAIEDAKKKKVFNKDLNIDYLDNSKDSLLDVKKVFHVCGVDFAEDMCNFGGEQGDVKHAVIVTREGKSPQGIFESHTNNYSRLIVNNDSKTSLYSSSKIQNGAYEQLPGAVQDEFKELHESAQCQAC